MSSNITISKGKNNDSISTNYLLYFAYGSNMNVKRLLSRTGSAVKWDNGMISGKKLFFNKLGQDGTGKANLIDHHGEKAFGVLFHVSEADLIKLDKFEVGYERKILKIKSYKQGYIDAISYLADNSIDFICPSKEYIDHIIQGADNNDMGQEYIKYLKTVPTVD